eukprot:TRINITY_DN47854_c0_g1_i1.p1 TRINITY_DN47854_c0_g1~~TRINITY_DN47854_c0_g1_i1.p1  ORF type:complete len:720 (+),score=151.37 TRINITY_DN47854_c0_g1_i1:66-2162(+)
MGFPDEDMDEAYTTIQVEPSELFEDLRKLFEATPALCNDKALAMSQCLLAAASNGVVDDLGFKTWFTQLRTGDTDKNRAIIDLLQGKKVQLSDDSQLFNLCQLARQLKISVCAQACQSVIATLSESSEEICVQLTAEQGAALREQLHKWLSCKPPRFADATFRFRKLTEDKENFKSLHVHAVIMAASCEYLRGLWTGSFSEAQGAAELQIEDESDASVVEALIHTLYGKAATLHSFEELVRLHCLADKWRCDIILSKTLEEIRENATFTDAKYILSQKGSLPTALSKLSVEKVISELSGSWTTSTWHGYGRGRKLITTRDPAKKMSLTAVARLLCATSDQPDLMEETTRPEMLERILADTDKFIDSAEWLGIPANIMAELLQVTEGRTELSQAIAKWAQHGCDDSGSAMIRIIQLCPADADEDMQSALRDAIYKLGPEPEVIMRMLSVTEDATSDCEGPAQKRRKTDERSWSSVLPALESGAKELLAETALDLAAKSYMKMSQCASWLELPASVLVRVARKAIKEEVELSSDEEVGDDNKDLQPAIDVEAGLADVKGDKKAKREDARSKPVVDWARAAAGPVLLEAMKLARDDWKGCEYVHQVLQEVVERRLVAAERQNIILEGGRHKEELQAAVERATADTEAAVRAELQEAFVKLQRQLEDERRLREEAAVEHKKCLGNVQEAVMAALKGALASGA